jgi:hypothetical protein
MFIEFQLVLSGGLGKFHFYHVFYSIKPPMSGINPVRSPKVYWAALNGMVAPCQLLPPTTMCTEGAV